MKRHALWGVAALVVLATGCGSSSKAKRPTAGEEAMEQKAAALEAKSAHENGHDLEGETRYYCEQVIPAMNELRATVDQLESIVPDEYWPLPTYPEMLFIK